MTPCAYGFALLIVGFVDLLAITIWLLAIMIWAGGSTPLSPRSDESYDVRRAQSIPTWLIALGFLSCAAGVYFLCRERLLVKEPLR